MFQNSQILKSGAFRSRYSALDLGRVASTAAFRLSVALYLAWASLSVMAETAREVDCKTGSPAATLNHLFGSPDHYFDYPHCLGQLPFEGGDFLVLSPPGASFSPLYLPAHKGLIRVGTLYDYDHTRDSAEKQMKKSLGERFARDMTIYANLLMADIHPKAINADEYLQHDNEFPHNQKRMFNKLHRVELMPNKIEFYPRWYLETLVKGILSTDGANRYLCQSNDCFRGRPAVNRFSWGGVSSDELTANRSFQKFMTDEFPLLKQWASELPRDVYLVYKLPLSGYDFDKKSFPLNARLLKSTGVGTAAFTLESTLAKDSWDRIPTTFLERNFTGLKDKNVRFEIPMDTERAEQFSSKHRFVYLVLKAKITGMDVANGGRLYGPGTNQHGYGKQFAVEVTSQDMDFYADSFLREKIHSITVSLR